MVDSYRAAVLRDTTQSIRSYSFELKYLISAHAIAFQGIWMHGWMDGWLRDEWMIDK